MELNVCIWDLARKENDDNIMIVDIEISDSDTIMETMLVELDMNYMGIDWDGKFEYELERDFQKLYSPIILLFSYYFPLLLTFLVFVVVLYH